MSYSTMWKHTMWSWINFMQVYQDRPMRMHDIEHACTRDPFTSQYHLVVADWSADIRDVNTVLML